MGKDKLLKTSTISLLTEIDTGPLKHILVLELTETIPAQHRAAVPGRLTDRKVRWKGEQSPHLHSLTYWEDSVILSSGLWLRNSGPESRPVKGTEQEVRGRIPHSSRELSLLHSQKQLGEWICCHYISHLRHQWPKAVVTYSLLSIVVRLMKQGCCWPPGLTQRPAHSQGPTGTGCPYWPHFHSGLSWDGWRTWGVLVSLPMWPLISGCLPLGGQGGSLWWSHLWAEVS